MIQNIYLYFNLTDQHWVASWREARCTEPCPRSQILVTEGAQGTAPQAQPSLVCLSKLAQRLCVVRL